MCLCLASLVLVLSVPTAYQFDHFVRTSEEFFLKYSHCAPFCITQQPCEHLSHSFSDALSSSDELPKQRFWPVFPVHGNHSALTSLLVLDSIKISFVAHK